MTFQRHNPDIDFRVCRYDGCPVDFRGPQVDITRPFVAVLGSSEVHGRYVRDPFPDLVGEALRLPVANLGIQNAGVDVFLRDDALLSVAARAEVVVVQVMGAHNMSNRFYTVHPRRNDRFLRHSKMMRSTFRNTDFSDFVFTRHMLTALRKAGPGPWAKLTHELEVAWIARMHLLLEALPGKVMLLWIENSAQGELGPEPLFVTRAMMDAVQGHADHLVHCDITDMIDEAHLDEMTFPPDQIAGARLAMPPLAHEKVARLVVRSMVPLLRGTSLKTGAMQPRDSVA